MNSRLILESIEISGYCGLTEDERCHPQPIAIDLEIDCENSQAGATDDIQDTLDYAQIINRLVEIGAGNQFHLVESLAEHITQTLFGEFPIRHLKLWVRKTKPPLKATVDSVGVRLERAQNIRATTSLPSGVQLPAPFLSEHQHQLPKGTILDLAAGHGRNTFHLATLGYSVRALDRDKVALEAIQQEIRNANLTNVSVQHQDLEDGSPASLNLGTGLYDGIIVFFYLYRPLFPALHRALKREGVLMYETFLIDNHLMNDHPRRKEFCLQRNELLHLTQGLRVLHYGEGARHGANGQDQIFTARIVAKKEGHTLDSHDSH